MQAVRVEQLSKKFDGTMAVQDLSFEVETGTIHGLVGPNGSGKTTTLRMIVGLVRPDRGSVTLSKQGDRESGPTVGYLPETPSFPGQMTALELMDYYARLGATHGPARQSAIEDLLDKVGLLEESRRKVETFTKGMRQRLGLAQALIGSPQLLVLDEPSAGLDPEGVVRFRGLLTDLAKKGTTVLLSTHTLDEVDKMCSHVTIMDRGRALATGMLEDLYRPSGTAVLEVELDKIEDTLVRSLYSLPFVQELTLQGKRILIHLSTADDVRAQVSRTIASCGSTILSLQTPKNRMEDAFLYYLSHKNEGRFPALPRVSREFHKGSEVRTIARAPERAEVGSDVAYEIDLVNVGPTPVWLEQIQATVPEKMRVKDVPHGFNFETGYLDLQGLRLDPLQAKNLRLVFCADSLGSFTFSPKVYYSTLQNEKRVHIADPMVVFVNPIDTVVPLTPEARKILEFLKSEFLHDHLDSNMNKESSGWRSLVQTAAGSGVSVSSLYGKDGRLGRSIGELLSRGMIESKTFHGQRGRGGEATKIRVRDAP